MNPIYIQLIIGLATPALTLIGVILSNNKSNALMQYKIEELSNRVNKHNSLIERTYKVEERLSVLETQIEDMEKKLG